MKICIKCKIKKDLVDFYAHPATKDRLLSICKCCSKEYSKKFKKTDKAKKYKKEYSKSLKGIEQRIRYSKTEKSKQYNKNYQKSPRARKRIRAYQNRLFSNNIHFKIATLLRSRLRHAIKTNQKVGSAVRDLGCSIEYFKKHLEIQFKPGMTWENHGEWHIDHIKPISKFDLTKRQELLRACNYTNMQPMWAVDNIKKSNK